jgi:uncharacterized protein YndB with AHSA1/START domain
MNNTYIATSSVGIKATKGKVWEALVAPELIKEYLFGTNVKSDWKIGSPITYEGMWEGKSYEDKGTIVNIVPEEILETTYWSSVGGLPDQPENYKKVIYKLEEIDEGTKLTITQDNNPTEESRDHSEKNWGIVLDSLKKLLEK